MFLYIDFRNDTQAIALVTRAEGVKWVRGEAQRGEFALLTEAAEKFALTVDPPQAVAAAIWPGGSTDVSWSTARTAVTVANTLAFAWGVPAVGLDASGVTEEGLADAVREAMAGVRPNARIDVAYSGDPNISQPKKIF